MHNAELLWRQDDQMACLAFRKPGYKPRSLMDAFHLSFWRVQWMAPASLCFCLEATVFQSTNSDCFSECKQRNSGVYWPEIPLGHNVLTSEFKLTLPIHLNHPKISSRFYCHFPQSSYFGCTPWLSLYRPWLDVFCGFV